MNGQGEVRRIPSGWSPMDGTTLALSHADYLRGLGATGAYPGYSDDPIDGFRHLALDLPGRCQGSGTGIAAGMSKARERRGSRAIDDFREATVCRASGRSRACSAVATHERIAADADVHLKGGYE
jgi:hypothetical protein